MNKKIFILIFLTLCGLHFASAQQHKFSVAVTAFYNLENLFDTIDGPNNDEDFLPTGAYHYTAEVYLDKLTKLASVLSEIGTDLTPDGPALIGCAEVENISVLRDLVKQPAIAGRNYQIVHYDSPDERGIDVALLYNPVYFKTLYSEPLFVELYNDDKTPRYTRDVLYIKGLFKSDTIHLLINHWPSRRGGEEASAPGRAKAASVAKHKIDSLTALDPLAKIILMGDLNDDPVSPSVAKVIGAKGDIKKVKPGQMYNPWMRFFQEGTGTLAYNDAWNLFDQILISSGWLDKKQSGWFYSDSRIFHKPWMEQQSGRYKGYPKRTYDFNRYIGGYSDHFPTYIILLRQAK